MSLQRLGFLLFLLLLLPPPAPAQPVEPTESKPPRTDLHGDPLPAGAIARMGSVRLRHNGGILDFALSSDGKKVTSFGHDGLLVDWSAESGKELRRRELPTGPFHSAALSPDCKLLATMNRGEPLPGYEKINRTVRLWDAETGKEICKITDSVGTIGKIAFAPDGKTLATVSQKHLIYLWEVPSGKLLRKLDGIELESSLVPIRFSPDSRTLISGGHDGKIRVWEVSTGMKKRELQVPQPEKPRRPGATSYVVALRFSSDGKSIVSSGMDQDVIVWDPATGQEIRRFKDHRSAFGSPGFSADSKSVLFMDKDWILRQWDVATGQERGSFGRGNESAFSADGATLAMINGSSIVLWDVAKGRDRLAPFSHPMMILTMALSPDGQTLATVSVDGFRLWETATGKPRGGPFGGAKHTGLAFSPDGKNLATTDMDNVMRLWDVKTGKEISQFNAHKNTYVRNLAYRQDGTILSGAADGIFQSNPIDGKVKRFAEVGRVEAMTVSPDGNRLLARVDGRTFCLWDVATRTKIWQVPGTGGGIFGDLAFSPDGKWFAVGGPKSVHLHSTTNGRIVREFGQGLSYQGAIALSPDGRTVATDGLDGVIRIWEIYSGQERQRFVAGPKASISNLAFRPNGSVISAGSEGFALVWDVNARLPARELNPAELDAMWADLAKEDAGKAFRAIQSLTAASKQAVPFLTKRLQAEKAIPAERLTALLTALASERLAERTKAAAELESLGELAEPALRKAAADRPALEQSRRIELILGKLPAPITPDQLLNLRAVEVLEGIGNVEAQQILASLAKGTPEARLTQEAQAARERLVKKAKTP